MYKEIYDILSVHKVKVIWAHVVVKYWCSNCDVVASVVMSVVLMTL